MAHQRRNQRQRRNQQSMKARHVRSSMAISIIEKKWRKRQ